MSEDLTTLEYVKEVLIDLRTEKVMSERRMSAGVQASSTWGVQYSPSTSCGAGTSRIATEMRMKHRDDLANVKSIPNILLTYIPPLSGAVNMDSVLRDFDYVLVTMYLSKGICIVRTYQDKIVALNFSDFNLEEGKSYSMLGPHKYLTKMKRKNSNIITHLWTHNLTQSTLLNVMNILHFESHQEVNACVKLLLSCYHGKYLWLDWRITVDMNLIHQITRMSMQGPDPHDFYPGKTIDW